MESHPNFKFKRGDVIVPKAGFDVDDFLKEITIVDVRPSHYEYKAKDSDGDLCKLNPVVVDENYELKSTSA